MQRREFIKNIGIAGVCAAAVAIGIMRKQNFIDEKGISQTDNSSEYDSIKHLDIHLTEHCNLNCKNCIHFSCIAEKEFLDVKKYTKDMAQLAKITKNKVQEFSLLGGEPLLHPQVSEIMSITRKYFPSATIYLVTNGLLLKSMPEKFWQTIKNENIRLNISLYDISLDLDKIYDIAKKYDIEKNEILIFETKEFLRLNLDLNGNCDINESWARCLGKEKCAMLQDGKIYPCFIIPTVRHFNKKFNQDLKVKKEDFVDIYKANNIKDFEVIMKSPTPFCRYCAPCTKNVKWANSSEHDISEWTYQFDEDA